MILKNLFKNEKRQEFVDRNTLFPNIRERVRSNVKELSRSPSDFLGATKERLGGVTGTLFSNVEEIRRSPGDFISAVPKSTRQKLKESPIATQSSRFLDGARDTLRDNREEFKRSPRLFLQSIPRAFDIRATQAGLRESLRGAKLKMLGQTLGIPFLNSLIPKSEETDEEYIQRKVKDINQNLLLVDIPPAIVKVFTQEGKAEKFKDIGLNNLAGGMQLTYSRIADRFSDSPAVLDEGHVQETLKSLSDTLRTASDRNLAEAREASGKLFQLNLKDPNNRQEAIAQAILVNSPNTLGALIVGGGAGLIGGPKASVLALYAYSSALEGGFARHEAEELAREQGKELTDRELDTLMAGVGIIGGALESFAPFRLLNRLSKTAKTTLLRNATRIMLQTGGEEGVTEVLQQLVSNMAMKLKDLKDDVFEGLSESGLIGFLSGLLFGGGGATTRQTLRRGAVGLSIEDINERIDTLEKRDELTPEEETELAQLKQSTDTQPLLEEARKFDSAEEFVEAQGEPVFHFTDKVNIASIEKDGLRATLETEGKITEGISLATKRTEANEIFGNAKVTVYINPKAKTITLKDALDRMGFAGETDIGVIKNLETKVPSWAAENGYDVLDMRDARGAIYKGMDEIRILNPEVIKTKSQLTDIFNQAKQQPIDLGRFKSAINQVNNFGNVNDFVNSQLDFIRKRGYYNINGETTNQFGERERTPEGEGLLKDFKEGTARDSRINIEADTTALTRVIRENPEGFTLNLRGKPVTNGFAVSPFKDRETKLDAVDKNSVRKFLINNNDVLLEEGYYLGGWKNNDDRKFYLDVAVVESNKNKALEIALQNDQIAIFDLSNPANGEIDTIDALTEIFTDIFNQSKQQIKGGPTPQKLGIQEGRPAPFVNKRETTLLKDRIRALARGTREGRADQKGDIREIQNDLIKEVSDVLPNDISRITRILRDTNTREKLLDAIVDIDRIAQNRLDKEQADLLRRKNINIARGLRQGGIQTRQTISERLRLLNDLIDNSNLTAKDKAKFRFTPKQISSIKNEATFQSKINDVVDRISKLESAERFRNARSRIEKIIKSTKIKNRISKFPAELQDSMQNMFNQFREDLKLNQDQAGEKIKEIMKELDGEIPTLQQKLRLQLLGIKVGSDLIDEQDATQIAEDLESIVEEGRGLKDLRTFEQWQDLQNNIEDILDGLELGEGIETFGPEKKSILEGIKNRLKILGINALTDWRGTQMDIEWNKPLGEKKIAETLGNVTPQNKQYANLYGQYDREVSRVIRESYPDRYKKKFKRLPDKVRNSLEFNPWTEGFSSKLVIIDLINEEVNLGKLKNRDGVVRELTFKRGELIKRWVELQDLTLTESFFRGNRYIQETIDAIDNAMTPQDKAFAKETMRMWQDLYDLINPVYKKIYGINLPKNPFYSNIRREGFEVDIENQFGEFLGEQNFRKAVTSGSFNERTNSILPIKTQDVFQALDKHFGEMTYFIAWAERVRQFHSIYNNKSVRDGVINTFGKNAGGKLLERIDFQIREFASKGHRNSTNFGKVAGKARRGFIMGKIFFKPVMFFKQLVSRVNWLEVLGPIELTTGEYEFWKSPKEKSKILRKESPILRERGKFFERDINDVLKSDEYARYSKFRAFLELGAVYTKVGDADATIFPGSWAYRKKLMKERGLDPNGQAPEEVIAIYEDFADNTNQSANISTQSEWQQSGPLAKLFTLFRTQQHQNARKVVNVVKSVFQEGGTSKKNLMKTARTIVIYHSIQNMLFQLVGTGLIQLIGDDDEEFVKDMARAGLLGSLNFLPLGYDLISSIIRAVMGSQVFNRGIQDTPISSISKDIYNLTREIDPTKIEDFEVMEFIQDLATVTSDFGPPAEQALNLGRGIHSMTEGNFLRGTLEMLQWSQWALEPLGEDEENVDLSIDLFKKKSKETERDTSLRRRGGSTGVTPRGGSTGVTPRGSNQNSVLKSMFR